VETDNNPYVFKLIVLAELLAVSSKTQAVADTVPSGCCSRAVAVYDSSLSP